jgi:2-methylcitrate dehydratase PrpD
MEARDELSQQIADFVYHTNYECLPEAVVDKAKQCFIDSIGVSLYGVSFEASRICHTLVKDFEGKEESSILGTKYKTPCFLAALANGISAHIADYDDTLAEFGHPSSILMPVTLALAEAKNIDGPHLLTAFILGNEVGAKLGQVMLWSHYEIGFHQTGTIGTIGAAVAACKLLKLQPSQITNALGIAASSASGLRQNFGTMTKSWHAGHAASAGLMAALFAQKGFNASPQAIDGEKGFVRAFQGGKGSFPVEQLGNPYSIMNVSLKRYPSCALTHPAVDALLKLKEQHHLQPEGIKAVKCRGRALMRSVLLNKAPDTGLEAKFSMEYCLAAALVKGGLERISLEFDTRMDEIAKDKGLINPSQVKVVLADGEELSQTVEEAKGGPGDPISWPEVSEKFSQCSRHILSAEQAERTLNFVRQLEHVTNVADLNGFLTPKK